MSKTSIAGLQRAYVTLGVEFSATPVEIERAYKARVEVESASRESLNNAYLLIAGAPLRAFAQRERALDGFQGGAPVAMEMDDIRPGRPDAFAYVVRFVCGALLGAVLAGSILLRAYFRPGWYEPWSPKLIVVVVVLLCGGLAAFLGDRFWYSIFKDRWFWSGRGY